jgi:glycosyltransferase involved in cell wall biosynthesis
VLDRVGGRCGTGTVRAESCQAIGSRDVPNLVQGVKDVLRRRIGIWVLYEWRNRVLLARPGRRFRRFESTEVERLKAQLGPLPHHEVSVVIATYRRPELLRAAVASALAQTGDIGVVVVDDGGGLPDLPDDPRLVAVSLARNTHTAGVVRNVGIHLTDSTYLAFLDDDNTWYPEHLTVALRALRDDADLVYTSVRRVRADGTELDTLDRNFVRREFADAAFVDLNSLVVRRTRRTYFSRLPRDRHTLPAEDWEFVYRVSGRARVRHLPEVTVRYLVNEESYYTNWPTDDVRPA